MYGKTGVNILSLSLSILTPDRNALLPGLPCIYLSIYFNAGPARPSAWLAREKERSSLVYTFISTNQRPGFVNYLPAHSAWLAQGKQG